ncbi:hypothetical protein [Brasilonema sp. UFV-L1]|uniref:hypothetical protein n=1 Tax=Brasilonema sp. UFV-L1 TaxID=2234130 RepID=UPI00145F4DE8|nr:hypothetical protein [Brasilonema sp. UFV-L1]
MTRATHEKNLLSLSIPEVRAFTIFSFAFELSAGVQSDGQSILRQKSEELVII